MPQEDQWSALANESLRIVEASSDEPPKELERAASDEWDILATQVADSLDRDQSFEQEAKQEYTGGDVGRQLLQGPAWGGLHNIEGVYGGLKSAATEALSSPEKPFGIMGEERGGDITGAFGEGFTEAREEGIDRNRLARERLGAGPATALEMAGSLAGSPLTTIGKGLTKLSKPLISKFAKEFGTESAESLVKDVGPEVAQGIMKRSLKSMGKGVKVGTVSGAVSSEQSDLEGILKDIGVSMGTGGLLHLTGTGGNVAKKIIAETQAAKKLTQYGVDAAKYLGKKRKNTNAKIANFFSHMSLVPEKELIKYAEMKPGEFKKLVNGLNVKNEKEFAQTFSQIVDGKLGEIREQTADRMNYLAREYFGDNPIPDSLRDSFVNRMKDMRKTLNPRLGPDRAKRDTLNEWISAISKKKPKPVIKDGKVVATVKPRQATMKDLLTLFEDAKNKMDFKKDLAGDPAKKGQSYQQMLKELTYDEDGPTIRKMMSEASNGQIDKVFKKYKSLHEIYDEAPKNLFKEGKSYTALKSATTPGDKGYDALKKADELLADTLKPGERLPSQLAEDFQTYRFFEDPDLAAFSTGRSLFAPMVGEALGSVFGQPGRQVGFGLGAAISSPRLIKYGLDVRKRINQAGGALGSRMGQEMTGPTMEAAAIRALEERMRSE